MRGAALLAAALLLPLAGMAEEWPVEQGVGKQAAPVEAATAGAVEPAGNAPSRGIASWYGLPFHGRRTASGERFDMTAFTAAHPTLPFGTRVKVTSLVNGREVTVRINDRGPHTGGRIIDLSHAAARALGLLSRGTKLVELTALPASH